MTPQNRNQASMANKCESCDESESMSLGNVLQRRHPWLWRYQALAGSVCGLGGRVEDTLLCRFDPVPSAGPNSKCDFVFSAQNVSIVGVNFIPCLVVCVVSRLEFIVSKTQNLKKKK